MIQQDTTESKPSQTPATARREARIVFTILALAVVGIGLVPLWTGAWAGYTKRSQYVTLDGSDARLMGAGILMMGVALLGVWMPGRRSVLAWLVTCITIALACFAALIVH